VEPPRPTPFGEPELSLSAATHEANATFTLPAELWPSYQLQYKQTPTYPGCSNLGDPVGGNDALLCIRPAASPANRFYRIEAR
jgi:hypothetical protein